MPKVSRDSGGKQVAKPRAKKVKKDSRQADKRPMPFAGVPNGFTETEVPCIPKHSRKSIKQPVIEHYVIFDPIGENKNMGLGLPVADCLERRGLQNPETLVFQKQIDNGEKSVTVLLHWPGYNVSWNVDLTIVLPSSGRSMTRGDLALALALQINKFVERCNNEPQLQSSEPQWRIGPDGGLDASTIRLSHLWMPSDDQCWQLSLRALVPCKPFEISADLTPSESASPTFKGLDEYGYLGDSGLFGDFDERDEYEGWKKDFFV